MTKASVIKSEVLKQFQTIPGIGKACSLDLWNIGLRGIEELSGQNPTVLYETLNTITGVKQDICLLYTFRCAVYFATEKDHEREKLNWWYWKDKVYNE
jgi:hypothetical protein